MPRPKSPDKLVPLMVRLAADEVATVDARRGARSRSDYVRSILVGPPPGGAAKRPPTDRQLAHDAVAAMQGIDPADAGPKLTPEEATFVRQWAARALDSWREANGQASEPRSPGRVIPPKAKAAAPTPPSPRPKAILPPPTDLHRKEVTPLFKGGK